MRKPLFRRFGAFVVVLSVLGAAAPGARAQSGSEEPAHPPRDIEVGQRLTGTLEKGQHDLFRISAHKGDFIQFRAVADQALVYLYVLDRDHRVHFDGLIPPFLVKPQQLPGAYLFWIADSDDVFYIKIRLDDPWAGGPSHPYWISFDAARPATDRDRLYAEALEKNGDAYRMLGNGDAETTKKSLALLTRAEDLWVQLDEPLLELSTLGDLAAAASYLGLYNESAARLERKIRLARALDLPSDEAHALMDMATVDSMLGQPRQALEALRASTSHFRQTGEKWWVQLTLRAAVGPATALGEYRLASDYLAEAASICETEGYEGDLKGVLAEQVLVRTLRDNPVDAMGVIDKYVEAARDAKDTRLFLPLLRQAGIYSLLGEYDRAIEINQEAEERARAFGHLPSVCRAAQGVGDCYLALGRPDRAMESYEAAQKIAKEYGYRTIEAWLLQGLGSAQLALGDLENARTAFQSAGEINHEVGNRVEEARALEGLGSVAIEQRETRRAIELLTVGLRILDGLDSSAEVAAYVQVSEAKLEQAKILNKLASLYATSDADRAVEYLRRARALGTETGNRNAAAESEYQLARVDRSRGRMEQARREVEEAIAGAESLRARVRNPDLQTSYFSTTQRYYELYVDLLMRGRQAGDGFTASERGRARGLLDAIALRGGALTQAIDPALSERERELRRALTGKLDQRLRLATGEATKQELAALDRELSELETEYQQVQGKLRAASPAYAALTSPEPVTVERVQRELLDDGTALVEYALGEERSYVWAVTTKGMVSAALAGREAIEGQARRVRELLVARSCAPRHELPDETAERIRAADAAYAKQAARLREMVLGPVEKAVSGKRLAVVADGALQLVPFGALVDASGHYEIERHEVVMLPSATALEALRRERGTRAEGTVAVVADPVFAATDPRVAEAKGQAEAMDETVARARDGVRGGCEERAGLERLEGSRAEAEAIAKLVPAGERMEALDFAANLDMATSGRLRGYRVVHIATHGYVPSEAPELSGLVLSLVDEQGRERAGYLGLPQIYAMRLNADEVVLSACETGLGKQVRGEGMVGLARGFMYAGARRVVASLWKVDDRPTAELMETMYARLLKKGASGGGALRAAQLEMLEDERWRAPYYWAAFQLYGEWR